MSGGGAGLGERGCGADAHAGCGRDSVVRGVDAASPRLSATLQSIRERESSRVALPTWAGREREIVLSLSLSLGRATHTGSFREFNPKHENLS